MKAVACHISVDIKEGVVIKVSVITVCFNSQRTIERTILSVLNQTYSNIEYIIIDGDSSDSTMDIVLRYNKMVSLGCFPGKEMKYVSENDNGIYDAMNKGIAQAKGHIIGIINSDDWYEIDAIEKIVKAMNQCNNSLIFYGNMQVYDGETSYLSIGSEKVDDIRTGMIFGHPTCFVPKEIYRKIGTFNTKYAIAADYEFLLRCYINGITFMKIDDLIANFSLGGISCTKNLMCAIETVHISMNHYKPTSCSEKILEKNISTLKKGCLFSLKKNVLRSFIGDERCCIFGSGIWGRNIQRICEGGGIAVEFIVDNDRSKWSEYVVSPSNLKRYEGTVIIATTQFREEIMNQLEGFENPLLRIVTLDEIQNMALEYMRRNNEEVADCLCMIDSYRLK